MYAEGITVNLFLITISVGFLAFILLRKLMPPHFLLIVILVKLIIPFVYFAWFFDGSWTFLDDITYYSTGKALINAGYSPLTSEALAKQFMIAHSPQFLYFWFNHFTQYIFGPYYYSPVFGNVFLTFVAGYYLYKISLNCGFGKDYSLGLLGFFLLQWDVLAWSSFPNLKDILALTITVALFYYLLLVRKKITWKNIFGVVLLMGLLSLIRFYLPLVVVLALVLDYLVGNVKLSKITKYSMIFIVTAGAFLVWYQGYSIMRSSHQLSLNPLSCLQGTVKMLLTPRPWAVSPDYSFLLIPSIINVIFLVPMLIGARFLWRDSKDVRLLIIYFILAIVLYGMSLDEVQGPRHRVQMLFVMVAMQYRFLWILLSPISQNISRIVCAPQK